MLRSNQFSIQSTSRNLSPRELNKSFDTSIFKYPIDLHYQKSPSPECIPPAHLLPSFLSKPEKSQIFPLNLKLPQSTCKALLPTGQNPESTTFPRAKQYKISSLNNSFSMKISTDESSREDYEVKRKPKKRPLNETEKQFYVIQIDQISSRKDLRTTVMIKNIPNKYTQKMLLHAIDKKFPGSYDFLYLPIDFKNKCNVGYAFINFVDCSFIIKFYQEFQDKRWEKFNSEKVCQLAYARIQGLAELISHFQNSSVINQEDYKVKPVVLAKN